MDDPKELFYPQSAIAEDFDDWTVQNDQLRKETSFAYLKELLPDEKDLKIEEQPDHFSIYCGGWFVADCGYSPVSEQVAQTIVRRVKCHEKLVEACHYAHCSMKKFIVFLREAGKDSWADALEKKIQLEDEALKQLEEKEKVETRHDFEF